MVTKPKELYCGVDVHYKRSYFCILNKQGEKIKHQEIYTQKEDIINFLKSYTRNNINYAFEACGMSRFLNNVLIELPNTKKIHLVNTNKFKIITESKRKNDKEDSRKLAEGLLKEYLPNPVYLKREKSRQMQLLLNLRQRHVKTKTAILQQTKSVFRSKGFKLTNSIDLKKGFLHFIEDVQCFNDFDEQLLFYQNKELIEIKQKITNVEKQIKELAEKEFSREFKILQTIPGIGFIVSAYLLAIIDDISRFKNANQLAAYFGLSPSENSSGDKVLHGSITKQGNKQLRRMLVQSAWIILGKVNKKDDARLTAICKKYQQLARKNKAQKAIVMVARRLARIVFGVLKNNEEYKNIIEQR